MGTPVVRLDEIVVVGDRTGSILREGVAATSLLTREDIAALPGQTLPEVLRSIPGIVFVDRDGSGRLPMAVVRGFFGGGETSYALLTVDGVPVNDDRTGLVEWTQIPLSEVERIEVLRGSASVMYGDAALGAVINVVTSHVQEQSERTLSLWTGSWGAKGLGGSYANPWSRGKIQAALSMDSEDGFRNHSRSSRGSGSLSFRRFSEDERRSLFARLSFSRIENQDPGPLPPEDLEEDPVQSLSTFADDERTRTVTDLVGGGALSWPEGGRLDTSLRFRIYDQDRTRTLLLTPSFGNTQRQADQSMSVWGRTQYSVDLGETHLRLGVEGELAGYRTSYRDAADDELLSVGKGRRLKLATHAEITRELASRLEIHAGVRYDRVRPEEAHPSSSAPSFGQWSPRVALNVAYARDPEVAGNLFVTWTRAFKAPTLDQLFDVRAIPTGVPGQDVVFSNALLKPQRSSAVELGFYQRVPLGATGRFGEVSATVYRQWLDDEIDFDLLTFKYGNIQRSLHTGFEGSVRAALLPGLELAHSATLTWATFRVPELEGNQLKNIPRTAFVTSGYLEVSEFLGVTLTHRLTGSVFLDDENTTKLAGSSLVDAAVTWRRGPLEATAAMRNVFDVRFDTFAYLLFDPFQQAEVRMSHPGSGRGLTLKLTLRERDPR